MNLVLIAGDAAVGKMTVGQELADRTGMKLLHNHITIEPIIDVMGKLDRELSDSMRFWWYSKLSKMNIPGVIITLMIDYSRFKSVEQYYIDDIIRRFEENTLIDFYYVELDAELDTRIQRNKTENRLNNKKSKRDLIKSEERLMIDYKCGRFISYENEVPYSNFLRIVNDNLTPEQQADIIINNFKFMGCT